MTTRKTKQPAGVVCHDGKRCKGTHPLICRDHGCGILAGRAAAAEKKEREPHARPRSTAARGSGALTWSAERPKRRGWWWFRVKPKAEPKIVEVYPNLDGDLITPGGSTFAYWESLWPELRWAGPLVAPDDASDGKSRPNAAISDVPTGTSTEGEK